MIKFNPKIVIKKSDDTEWVYSGSMGELSERLFAPNYYYFSQVTKKLFKGFIVFVDKKTPMDIDMFGIPKQEQPHD